LSEALLFYAARADHLDKTIRPALASGRWVICDRFSDSTRVYQSIAGGVDPAAIDVLERLVVRPTTPDLTVIIDLAADVGLARAARRRQANSTARVQPDAYEKRDMAFHERLCTGYLAIAAAEPQRCVLFDGAAAPDAIAAAIWASVTQRLLQASP
jgi:dTMP kinase